MTSLEPTILAKFLGNPSYFKEDFILKQLKNRIGLQRDLYDRSLNGLEFLAQLRNEGLDPIFKGGSAVQLLIRDQIQRLSIDLDLAVDISESEIVQFLNKVYQKFDKKMYNFEKSKRMLPDFFCTYYILIPSIFSKGTSKIELDFLLHKPGYQIQEIRLKNFLYDSKINVKIPTIDSLIGDKLTVLAPKTIGKPMRIPIQYSKQLYDISTLLEISTDIKAIYNAYLDVFEFEKLHHNLKETDLTESLDDLIDVCKLYALAGYTPSWITDDNILKKIQFLRNGVENLYPYTVSEIKIYSASS